MNLNKLKADLEQDEGRRARVYRDTAGLLTIGIGHNLSAKPITDAVIDRMYEDDLDEVIAGLDRALPWWSSQPEPAQRALANLCFNMGIGGLLKFKRTLTALKEGRYADAAEYVAESLWAKQVQPSRVARIQRLMREGWDL